MMKAVKLIVLSLFILAIAAAGWFLPVREWLSHFEAYIRSLGALGPVIMALLYIVCTVFLVPGSAISLAAGTLFGVKIGLITVIVGANLGALCAFLLARGFLREKVKSWAAAAPKFQILDRAVGRAGFKIVLLARLSPLFPFVWLNYFLGLTAVRTGAYAAANLVGMLPGALLYVWLGAAAREALGDQADAAANFYRQLFQYAGLAVTLVTVLVITRVARKALAEAAQTTEAS
jgi:uncharacterized membrane protein YdjX (TVP38/TMEM64 family)